MVVDQLVDIFHTTTKVKSPEVVRISGQRCGDIELTVFLTDVEGPVNLVISGPPGIVHESWVTGIPHVTTRGLYEVVASWSQSDRH